MGLFGAIVGNVVVQQARDTWKKLPRAELACLDRGLAQQGASLNRLIESGVPADDARLSGIRAECARFSAPLRQNVECPISTSDGDFVSRCDEGWALPRTGSGAPVTVAEAVEATFSGDQASIALFERPDAKSRRQQMIAAGAANGRVPTPNFDCAKAASPTERAICQSSRLSALDGEYGALYQRARPYDKKGIAKKQALKFWQAGIACQGQPACIDHNLTVALNFMADFLRRNGQTVVTSLEHEKEDAAAAAARAEAKRQQEEAARKQQEAAAAEAEQKKADLDAALVAAKALVAETSEFLAWDKTNPKVLALAKGLASLNAAMKATDGANVRAATSSLSELVHADPRYSDFIAAKAAKLAEDNARYLADATKRLARQKAFMVAYIAENPLSDASASFVGEVDGIDALLKAPDLGQLRGLSDRLDGIIAQHGLTDRYTASLTQPDEAPSTDKTPAPSASGVRSMKNAFLLDGPLGDVILMYNASNPPHVHKNLRGDFVFSHNAANVCLFQEGRDPDLLDAIRSAFSSYNLDSLEIATEPCPVDAAGFDIIAVRRGDFLNEDPADSLPLLKAIETDMARPMATVAARALADAAGTGEKARKQIEADIAHGAVEGYGLVLLPTSPGDAICAVVQGQREGHLAILGEMNSRLGMALGINLKPPGLYPSAEAAFAEVQRKSCVGVYASARDLKELLPALTRERIAYRLDEKWITPDDVDSRQAAAEKQDADEKQKAVERQQKLQEEQLLEAQRSADETAVKSARQAALRQQFGSLATARATALVASIRDFMQSPEKGNAIAQRFPDFADWYAQQVADHWELLTLGGQTADYGRGEWKGRSLEATVAEVSLRLRNVQLGRYQQACFDFGEFTDAEFDGVKRDPIVVPCDQTKTLADWKTGHRFVSQWNAE